MSLKGAVEVLKVLRGKVNDFFVIDKSLSISGACADAKATGDALGKKVSHSDMETALESKVNVSDIADNLATDNAELPLSANQGSVLKSLIDFINKVAMEDRGELTPTQMSELDDLTGNGVYWLDISNITNSNLDGNGFIFTYQSDESGNRIQEYISESGCKCRRYCGNNADWTEWEWENPPLMTNVEYRTTERFRGKPVYVCQKRYNLLAQDIVGDYADITLTHGIQDFGERVRYNAIVGESIFIPYHTVANGNYGGMLITSCNTQQVNIREYNGVFPEYTFSIDLYYTKTTN